jgi:hypothetical protein
MPKIAEAVNSFTDQDVQREAWEPRGVLSVLVERWVRGGGVLVMRRSWVRFPQAAPFLTCGNALET